jgi:hypothetical protein
MGDADREALAPLEADLLTAAFLPQPEAIAAWRRWRASVDWEGPVGAEVFSLLPRVRANLLGQGEDDPLFPRFQGIARQAWLRNQRRIAELQSILRSCQQAGVALLLLPPQWRLPMEPRAVLMPGESPEWAMRSSQAAAGLSALLRAGWTIPGVQLPAALVPGYVLGTDHLQLRAGSAEITELSWRLEWWFPGRDEAVWQRSTASPLGHAQVLMLDRTDALEFSLRQASGHSLLRDMVEVLAIATGPGGILWQRLDTELLRYPLPKDRRVLLERLQPFLGCWGAPPRLDHWCAEGPSRAPAMAPTPRAPSVPVRLRQDWLVYQRAWGKAAPPLAGLLQLPGYLMARWRLTHPRQLANGLGAWLRWRPTP